MIFYYEAIKEGSNEKISGTIEGESPRDVRDKIKKQGFLPIKVKEISQNSSTESDNNTNSIVAKLSLSEKIQFTSELESLLTSQIPVLEALETIKQSAPNRKIKYIANSIQKAIGNGYSLAQAFEKFKNIFDNVYIGLVAAGEKSGNIDKTFGRIVRILKKQQDVKWKVINALIYPGILCTIIFAVTFIFTFIVIPKFMEMYSSIGGELPPFTKAFLGFFSLKTLLICFILLTTFIFLLKTPKFKALFDYHILKVPMLSDFIRAANLSNFIAVLEVSYEAGIPISKCLEMAGSTVKNVVIKKQAANSVIMVNKGHTLTDSFKSSHILDPVSENMIATGEKSGELGHMLYQISENFDRLINNTIDILSKAVEPVMLIIMGIVVVIILLAFVPVITGAGLSI